MIDSAPSSAPNMAKSNAKFPIENIYGANHALHAELLETTGAFLNDVKEFISSIL